MPHGLTMVGVSGGVDSSVAAWLLSQGPGPVAGLFMQNWEEDDRFGPCRADEDRRDAVAVCARLGIPFHARNFAREYWDQVFEHFIAEYRSGRTPNPDVLCNREIKFKTFLDHARALGAERIATGHYARIENRDGQWLLLRALDTNKDQSYFLHALGQQQLAATVFPLGDMLKPEVRRLAREANLPTHAKKDSTGICFIGERDIRDFLGRYIPARAGEIQTPDGHCIGEHQGCWYYTLGQRGGLGIGGRRDSSGEPWYVVGKDVPRNIIFAVQGQASEWLQSRSLVASQLTWIAGIPPAGTFRCTAMIRYRQEPQACMVELDGNEARVSFDEMQRAVSPGQSVVFYQGNICLGGGIIESSDAPLGRVQSAARPMREQPEPSHA